MKLLKAKKKDFEEVYSLLKELWPKEKLSKKKTKIIYEEQVRNKNYLQVILKEKEEKEIIAYASINIREDIQSQGKIAYLSELIVQEKQRGKGHGKKILKKLITEAKKLSCKEMQFPSTFKRKKAHAFYKKLFFKKTAYFFWKKI